jgi:chromosome partitioning protein
MCRVIAVCNNKGGVGKTTASANIAWGLARRGFKVGVIDLDPQGNLSDMMLGEWADRSGIMESTSAGEAPGMNNAYIFFAGPNLPVPIRDEGRNIDIFPCTNHLAQVAEEKNEDSFDGFSEKLEKVVDKYKYDFLMIDTLPSLTNLQVLAIMCATDILIPTSFEKLGVQGVHHMLDTTRKIQRNNNVRVLGVFNAMGDSRETINEGGWKDLLIDSCGDLLLETKITQSVKVKEASTFNMSCYEYSKQSKQSLQYESLIEELLERMEIGNA